MGQQIKKNTQQMCMSYRFFSDAKGRKTRESKALHSHVLTKASQGNFKSHMDYLYGGMQA